VNSTPEYRQSVAPGADISIRAVTNRTLDGGRTCVKDGNDFVFGPSAVTAE
jgi:hypothetical protein